MPGEATHFLNVDLELVTRADVDALLASMLDSFLAVDGVLSVDYTRLEETDDQYLVVFRYTDQAARERFVASAGLKDTMAALRQLWDLESPIYRGTALH